jgi:hypothetical protein
MTPAEVKARLDAKVASLKAEKEKIEGEKRAAINATFQAAHDLRDLLSILQDYEVEQGVIQVKVRKDGGPHLGSEAFGFPVLVVAYDGDIESHVVGFIVSCRPGETPSIKGLNNLVLTPEQALERAAQEVEQHLVAR